MFLPPAYILVSFFPLVFYFLSQKDAIKKSGMRKNVRNGFPKSKYHFFLDCPFLFLLKYRSCKNQIENTSKTINVICPLSDGRARLLSFFVGKNQT